MKPDVNIGRLKFSGSNPSEHIEQLRQAVAKFEIKIYEKSGSGNAATDITAIEAEIASLRSMVLGLSVVGFPGFGTTHATAAYGDHTHDQSKFFSKHGSQDAVAGVNTVVFDSSYSYSVAPQVMCWLEYTDGFWSALVVDSANITAYGFTVNVDNIENAPKLKYFTVGS
jgi:hypothetical protein